MKKRIATVVVVAALIIIGFLAVHRNKPAAAPHVASKGSYVALGDSVAAGVGLKYDSDASACNRTDQAYPNIVATELHYSLANVACSGATLTNGILGAQEVNMLASTPQLDALFAQPKPNLITITVGANDTNWTDILRKCYTAECGSAEDTAAVQAKLATVTTNLKTVLKNIQQHYGAHQPHILVTGYYQVFPKTVTGNCPDLTGIDTNEIAWGRQFQSNINQAVQAAVKDTAANYVAIDFSGHELCTTDPWVQGLVDSQPYHPTAAGQRAMASQIISAFKTKATP